MALEPAPYIPVSLIQSAPVKYVWDDEDPYRLVKAEQSVLDRLQPLTEHAKIAFAAGCAEWVRLRFGRLFADPVADDYIEANWVMLIDRWACQVWQLKDPLDWLGPIRGPIMLAMVCMTNAWVGADEGGGDYPAALASAVARYVLPPAAPFAAWQDKALARLNRLYPANNDEDVVLGPPVVREALDPAVPLTLENQPVFVRTFLANLRLGHNPFIVQVPRPPEAAGGET